ncbi:MAG: hypothetical protein DLM61_11965, partial [Pseudonocardiales bacterium]
MLADLSHAIAFGEQALAGTPNDHPNHEAYLSNLAVAYRLRFERNGVLTDLDRAIKLGEHVTAGVPDDDANREAYMSNLKRLRLG